jgi:hypothetical protein
VGGYREDRCADLHEGTTSPQPMIFVQRRFCVKSALAMTYAAGLTISNMRSGCTKGRCFWFDETGQFNDYLYHI